MCPRFAGSRRGRRFGGGSRSGLRGKRPLEWECADLVDQIALPAAVCDQTVLISELDFDTEYSDSTLERIRGMLRVTSPQGAGIEAHGAAGIIEVEGVDSIDAIVQCPLTDCDASWIWHTYWSVVGQGVEGGVATGSTQVFEIDARARRRMEAGDSSLFFAIENDALSTSVNYWWGVRMLFAEK